MPVLAESVLTTDLRPEACLSEETSVRCDLAAKSLAESGRLRLQVRGESMLPSLWPGDEVEIARCTVAELRDGEVVLALRGGRFFLHRFVCRSRVGGFFLRGDSMPACDPEFPADALLGRIVRDQRAPGRPVLAVARCAGLAFCHCAPVRRLALKLHARWAAVRGRPGIKQSSGVSRVGAVS